MRQVLAEVRAALFATMGLAVVCGGLYPLVVFGLARLAFREQADGSLIADKGGVVRGSRLLGQTFTNAAYFHPRPSAAGNGYDAANSGGSNLGPTSKKLSDTIKDRVEAYRKENRLPETEPVPADAVTASGSGLDPDISPESARNQIARIAVARGITRARIIEIVDSAVERPQLGFLGEERVNVLRLNLALDAGNSAR